MSTEIEKPDNESLSTSIEIVEDCTHELDVLEQEAAEIDGLYADLKEHFDVVKQNSRKASGGLKFISDQTANLISLKNLKVSMIKARIDIKNKRFSQVIKVKTTLEENKNGSTGTFNAADIAKELIKLDPSIKTKYTRTDIDAEYVETFDVDSELDRILEENNLVSNVTSSKEVPNTENVNTNVEEADELDLVADEFGCIHVVDKDLNAFKPEDYGIDTKANKVEIFSAVNDKKEDIGLQARFMGEIIPVIPSSKLKISR
jgi:hypothetical protein